MDKISQLGQIFTPPDIVAQMLQLRKNTGRVLEPASGKGAFANAIPECISIEIDPEYAPYCTLSMDFFDYPTHEKFETIIGNPPYVRYQDILPSTKLKLHSPLLNKASNLYLFFIEKCIHHLTDAGELIFITPRDFLKATASMKLNEFIYQQGTITDYIDLGDAKIFHGFAPNCVIFRFEKGNFTRKTNLSKHFICYNGQLFFTDTLYSVPFKDIFSVKVGAVSGLDKVFHNEVLGNEDFVCSSTARTGKTKRMIFNTPLPYLESYKSMLMARKVKKFNESNWWQWGRLHHLSDAPRIYVNAKTRNKNPFFTHPCKNYDGSILAIFPKDSQADVEVLCEKLNAVPWQDLGFVCNGRYLFSQRSLENTLLPSYFKESF